jgi:hypothetical protein
MRNLWPVLIGLGLGMLAGTYASTLEVRHDVRTILSQCHWVKQ